MTPKYRADIDGLRAIAVLSVMLFHSGISIFSGGYVGVDVFFVISGYLITTIIVREIASDEFSIAKFYERRIRRILPLLVVVISACLATGFLILPPQGVIELGQSTIASIFFSSNILFFFKAGYFDTAAELKPLWHTWSLSVEEQYYILFPLILIFIAKTGGKTGAKHYLTWLIIFGVISFLASIYFTGPHPWAAFYWLPTRGWELLVGSILSLRVIPTPSKRIARETASFAGIAMIASSVFLYTEKTAFPGIAAALPTIGAALIIYSGAGGQSLCYRILTLRPIVFIGLISYSLYLWHWPVIVYSKIWLIKRPTALETLSMLLLTFILSVTSWKYIELPFRKKTVCRNQRSLFATSIIASIAIGIIGITFITHEGYPNRLAPNPALTANQKDREWNHWLSCESAAYKVKNSRELCDLGSQTASLGFILWGDSHARALASGIDLSASNTGSRGKIATRSACPPLLSIERPNRMSCNEFNQKILGFISDTPEIKTVILAARWALSTKGTRYGKESIRPARLIDIESPDHNKLSNAQLFDIGLTRTIEKLRNLGKEVVLVYPIPEVGYNVPYEFMVSTLAGRDLNNLIAPTREAYRKRTQEVDATFRAIHARFPISFVYPESYLCNSNRCNVVADGVSLYRDDNHLSTFGSKYVSRAFDKVLAKHNANVITGSPTKALTRH